MYKVRIPISRFKREIKKWVRYIKDNPEHVIYITRNNIDIGAFISPTLYLPINNN